MTDFLDGYSIQYWLESCPQGYLLDTVYGHAPDAQEPEVILTNPTLREDAIRGSVQLVVGERAALAASSASALRRSRNRFCRSISPSSPSRRTA